MIKFHEVHVARGVIGGLQRPMTQLLVQSRDEVHRSPIPALHDRPVLNRFTPYRISTLLQRVLYHTLYYVNILSSHCMACLTQEALWAWYALEIR